MNAGARKREPTMADAETERAIGRLEGRLATFEDRIGDIAKNILERLAIHDQNSRDGLAALRQDVVHANTELRNRMEDGFGDMNESLTDHTRAIADIKSKQATGDGAAGERKSLWDRAFQVAPYLIGSSGLAAIIATYLK